MDLPRLTPAEFEIMDAVWEGEEMTVTEVMNQLNAFKEKPFSRSTIQVQMQRLAEKGWLRYREEGNTFLYSATVERSEATAHIVEEVRRRVFGDSCTELVRTLLDHTKISSRDIAELRKLIDQYTKRR
jgi:BlaI family transcriptional regulator, penicillinase repressor